MILSIAWRNVWRNKVRSIIMIVAIALGLTAGVFATAFMLGAVESRIESATRTELAHLQVHAPRFMDNNETGLFISNAGELTQKINLLDEVDAACYRLIAEPFIMAAHGTGGGKMLGIVPEMEKEVTNISQKLVDGTYLEKNSRMPPVLIGEKLAKKLKLKVGSKLNVQMVDMNGDLSSKGYRVSGIYRTVNTGFDETNLFVLYDDLKKQLGLHGDVAHEIAMICDDANTVDDVKTKVQQLAGNDDVKTWKEISPEMSILTESMDQYMYIFILIILLGLCFGIVNTMLMAVLERTKEIGMLMAVGMNKRKVFGMIMLESVMLTLTGGLLGVLTGSLITRYFETRPIDVSAFSEGLEKYGYATKVYTALQPDTLVIITFLVILTGIISAVYPARKALKLNPAEATRTE